MINANLLSANPLIVAFDDFVSEDVTEHIQAVAEGKLQRANEFTASGSRVSDRRTNLHCDVNQMNDPMVFALCKQIGILISFPPENAESMVVLKYEPGQQYEPHYDAYDFKEGSVPPRLVKTGQRFFTSLVYLNDGFEGGATSFPRCDISVTPRRGRLLIWGNTILGGNRPHPRSIHAGDPVVKGEKWAATLWWRRKIIPEPAVLPAKS